MLDQGLLEPRSVTIAIYALCGFANIGSIGVVLGGLGHLAPTRREELARMAVPAMIAGTLATCLTAAIAGALS
jgi:CNT family concentrative nucleoside transporter